MDTDLIDHKDNIAIDVRHKPEKLKDNKIYYPNKIILNKKIVSKCNVEWSLVSIYIHIFSY